MCMYVYAHRYTCLFCRWASLSWLFDCPSYVGPMGAPKIKIIKPNTRFNGINVALAMTTTVTNAMTKPALDKNPPSLPHEPFMRNMEKP